jgi:hypothetical protein
MPWEGLNSSASKNHPETTNTIAAPERIFN